MGYGQSDARGYVDARDPYALDAYRKLLRRLGLADRDPFETLREDPYEDPREAGRAWDASLSERDPGWVRAISGERWMEREDR